MAVIEALVACCSLAVSVPATAVPATAVPATAVPQPADQAAVPVTQICKSWPARQLPEDLQLGRLSYTCVVATQLDREQQHCNPCE